MTASVPKHLSGEQGWLLEHILKGQRVENFEFLIGFDEGNGSRIWTKLPGQLSKQ